MKALTIKQPWASAITWGGKDVENRTWPAPHKGLLAIHAGKAVDWDGPDEAWTAAGLAPYRPGAGRQHWTASLPLGAIIAVAHLAGSHQYDDCMVGDEWAPAMCSPWAASGQWHWGLTDVRPLREPVPCKGALGLWTVPAEAEAAVIAQLEASRA